jgi:hypothetical protein
MAIVVFKLGEVYLKCGGLVTSLGGGVEYEVDVEIYYRLITCMHASGILKRESASFASPICTRSSPDLGVNRHPFS